MGLLYSVLQVVQPLIFFLSRLHSLCSENVFLHPFDTLFIPSYASLVAQRLKCLPPMQETHIGSLGKEDPLEKEMATHSSILAWEIPWMEELGRLQSTGSQRVGHN